jgi:hypothetical protein
MSPGDVATHMREAASFMRKAAECFDRAADGVLGPLNDVEAREYHDWLMSESMRGRTEVRCPNPGSNP